MITMPPTEGNRTSLLFTSLFSLAGTHPEQAAGLQPNCNFKNTDFVDIKIFNVLHHLPFSQNQPLKSADD
jgi:hypothetical protein